jgi:L-ascorbate metabolism protein UlaG (beta-lactamase superfamily)
MNDKKIKVEYIYHSGYTIETEKHFMVFDYFKGDIELPDKPVIVFVSHSHPDHFNEDIFKWTLASSDITYILSDDIMVPSNGRIRLMGPYERLDFTDFSVDTFGSTDQGVSFLVNVDGIRIFFAGDLHWWHWEEDSPEEKALMERDFKNEMERIRGNEVDIAFFPVDPRLGKNYALGGRYFIDNIEPKHFFPLHFGDNFEILRDFINIPRKNNTHIHMVERRNQIFEVK